jgi:DNA-binding PadR family transcriptional regulator
VIFSVAKYLISKNGIYHMSRTYLGEFEEVVLLMVAVLNGNAYGVNTTHEIIEQTNRNVRLNQVHASLQRLEEKGMIESQMGEPTAERGGRRKRLFRITAFGQQTLKEIQSVRSHLWNSLPEETKTVQA